MWLRLGIEQVGADIQDGQPPMQTYSSKKVWLGPYTLPFLSPVRLKGPFCKIIHSARFEIFSFIGCSSRN